MGEIIADGYNDYVAVVQSGEVIFFTEGDKARPFLEAAQAGAQALRRKLAAFLGRTVHGPVTIRLAAP